MKNMGQLIKTPRKVENLQYETLIIISFKIFGKFERIPNTMENSERIENTRRKILKNIENFGKQ